MHQFLSVNILIIPPLIICIIKTTFLNYDPGITFCNPCITLNSKFCSGEHPDRAAKHNHWCPVEQRQPGRNYWKIICAKLQWYMKYIVLYVCCFNDVKKIIWDFLNQLFLRWEQLGSLQAETPRPWKGKNALCARWIYSYICNNGCLPLWEHWKYVVNLTWRCGADTMEQDNCPCASFGRQP